MLPSTAEVAAAAPERMARGAGNPLGPEHGPVSLESLMLQNLIETSRARAGTFIRKFARDEEGAALAEYAVTFLVIAIAGTAGLVLMGEALRDAFLAIGAWITANITGAFPGGGG